MHALSQSGLCVPLTILRDGAFAGYLCESVRNGEPRITELELADPELYPAVMKAYWEKRATEGFSVELAWYRTREFDFLEKICGRYLLRQGHQYDMADLKEVLRFFLRAKKELFGLSDGEWSFRVREEEETALFFLQREGRRDPGKAFFPKKKRTRRNGRRLRSGRRGSWRVSCSEPLPLSGTGPGSRQGGSRCRFIFRPRTRYKGRRRKKEVQKMSEQFQIISDGSCDLPPELAKRSGSG